MKELLRVELPFVEEDNIFNKINYIVIRSFNQSRKFSFS